MGTERGCHAVAGWSAAAAQILQFLPSPCGKELLWLEAAGHANHDLDWLILEIDPDHLLKEDRHTNHFREQLLPRSICALCEVDLVERKSQTKFSALG